MKTSKINSPYTQGGININTQKEAFSTLNNSQ